MITDTIIKDLKKDLKRYKTLQSLDKEYNLAYSMIADYIEEKIEIYSK